MNFLPPARNSRWFAWYPGYALIVWLLLVLHRFVLLGSPFSLTLLVRWAVLALVFSGIISCFGWLGARLVWMFSTAGLVLGIILMYIYTYRDMSGWEDLAGFLTFALFTAGGFVLGLIVEAVLRLVRYLRKHRV
ncbi:hypothetical protein [Paenibacillus sp. MMS20-IR301]|uniref:hypothetical protein n=1 Tax=Paenibacillus sp. MMS20-IR301 TaxID=2895946 RepID=UPI0028E95BA1|nr:hypothetical protein [Paenibacillus sp. MMS20-IR301]WNS40956.1 hypothetical protein LOS79_18075 [Paenibacillus sp. MMS20-IR301]